MFTKSVFMSTRRFWCHVRSRMPVGNSASFGIANTTTMWDTATSTNHAFSRLISNSKSLTRYCGPIEHWTVGPTCPSNLRVMRRMRSIRDQDSLRVCFGSNTLGLELTGSCHCLARILCFPGAQPLGCDTYCNVVVRISITYERPCETNIAFADNDIIRRSPASAPIDRFC